MTRDLRDMPPQRGIDGTVTEIHITRQDLADLELFDCTTSATDDDLFRWILDADVDDVDEVSDRAKTIVAEYQD